MIKRKISKKENSTRKVVRKNPSAKNNPNNIKYFIYFNSENFHEIGEGTEGRVFYFKLNSRLVFNTEVLNKGEYALKLFYRNYTFSELGRLEMLSKYGLIPKIYIFDSKYIIMKYIKGISLDELSLSDELTNDDIKSIDIKIGKLCDIWIKLGFRRYIDNNDANILVTDDLKKVYFIDPMVDDKWWKTYD